MRDELRGVLRAAVYRGDGVEIVRALDATDVSPYLQLAGDGILVAVVQSVTGAPQLAHAFLTALRERDWDGDEELAAQLDAGLGNAEPADLIDLPVPLDELSELLEDGQGEGGAIDLRDGSVWPMSVIDHRDEIGEPLDIADSDAWLDVDTGGSRPAYRDMEAFIDTVTDPNTSERLWIAIDGTGAFGRFRRVLDRDDELHTRWYGFSEERRLGRARAWLTRAGYRTIRQTDAARPEHTDGLDTE